MYTKKVAQFVIICLLVIVSLGSAAFGAARVTNVRYVARSVKGLRYESIEDRCALAESPTGRFVFLAVFDGHGGTGVADWAVANMGPRLFEAVQRLVQSSIQLTDDRVRDIFEDLCISSDKELEPMFASWGQDCPGSAAIMALIDKIDHKIHIANLGDSRAVLFDEHGHILVRTNDHRSTNPAEYQKVVSVGGFIKNERLGGCLGLTRALGDFHVRIKAIRPGIANPTQALSALARHMVTPDVMSIELVPGMRYGFVLASDGLWDYVSSYKCTMPFVEYIKARFLHLVTGLVGDLTSDSLVRVIQEARENLRPLGTMWVDDMTVAFARIDIR